MTVSVQGENRYDICRQLGCNRERNDIGVKWRSFDFGRKILCGCIIFCGNKVPLEFKDAKSALSFLTKTLKERDAEVKKSIKDEAKKAKHKK